MDRVLVEEEELTCPFVLFLFDATEVSIEVFLAGELFTAVIDADVPTTVNLLYVFLKLRLLIEFNWIAMLIWFTLGTNKIPFLVCSSDVLSELVSVWERH